ncbi:transmembrane protein 230-like [Hippopotamus amphibius kiboko]|uniref:transmembrane protein 230-like n=1 Tax=Hippopotamus amphibius kiboko TaxID=575201 RepID=UPI002597EFAE|nr:transmembrane protein 230-like [Hippopotamus amphibius kiboko]
MVPTLTNVAAGIPSSKVKYSKLSSPDGGHMSLKFKKSPTNIPYKAIACATLQFLIGAFLIITGCLLLAGYISKTGANRAFPVLTVGILVSLPGCYHLIIAYKAHRGCQGYSYRDLPDCDD